MRIARKNAPVRLTAAKRRQRIWELALYGKRPAEIAELVRMTPSAVRQIISEQRREIEQIPTEDAEKLRKIETQRLETLLSALMDKCLAGTVDAIRAATTISDQISRLWGLYMPTETKQIVDVRIELTKRLVAVLQNEGPEVRQRVLSGIMRVALPPEGENAP